MTSAASAGCHRLIRDYGATLVTNPDEMAELVGGVAAPDRARDDAPPVSSEATRLLDSLSVTSPRGPADLAARSGLSIATVQSLLGTLELDGRVSERERGWVKAKGS